MWTRKPEGPPKTVLYYCKDFFKLLYLSHWAWESHSGQEEIEMVPSASDASHIWSVF